MFGIRGLDPFGLLHSAIGLSALLLGLAVISLRKGTQLHKRVGYAYAAAMLLLNATALTIYDLNGRFGPFHAAAVISLATVFAALVPAVTRRPRGRWLRFHSETMAWSYVGLVSAFLAEIAVRLPGVSIPVGATAGTLIGIAGGAFLIYRLLPRTLTRTRSGTKSSPLSV